MILKIETPSVENLENHFATLEAYGIERATIPTIQAFDEIARRYREIREQRNTLAREHAERVARATADYAAGVGTLEDVQRADTDARNLDHQAIQHRINDTVRQLMTMLRDAMAGHEAEWIAFMTPHIEKQFDVLRSQSRSFAEDVAKWSRDSYGPRPKPGHESNHSMRWQPNPTDGISELRDAWKKITYYHLTLERLRTVGILPGYLDNLPKPLWHWRATTDELAGSAIEGHGNITIDGAFNLMIRGIAPHVPTLAEVRALNNLNNADESENML